MRANWLSRLFARRPTTPRPTVAEMQRQGVLSAPWGIMNVMEGTFGALAPVNEAGSPVVALPLCSFVPATVTWIGPPVEGSSTAMRASLDADAGPLLRALPRREVHAAAQRGWTIERNHDKAVGRWIDQEFPGMPAAAWATVTFDQQQTLTWIFSHLWHDVVAEAAEYARKVNDDAALADDWVASRFPLDGARPVTPAFFDAAVAAAVREARALAQGWKEAGRGQQSRFSPGADAAALYRFADGTPTPTMSVQRAVAYAGTGISPAEAARWESGLPGLPDDAALVALRSLRGAG